MPVVPVVPGGPAIAPPRAGGPAAVAMADLDRLERELADVEVALACISGAQTERCRVCCDAARDGSLSQRPALAACAADKGPAVTGADPAASAASPYR